MTERNETLPHTPRSRPSRDAANSMVGPSRNQRYRIWEFIHGTMGTGATCDEVEQALGIIHASCSTRIMELRLMGRIEETEQTRPTRSNRQAMVYVAVEPLFWSDKRSGWPAPPKTKMTVRKMKARIRQLETVIRALGHTRDRYYPDGCWCDVAIGNPMCRDHSGACKMAQRAMKGVE